jgi:quinol monooxygenase YgiN
VQGYKGLPGPGRQKHFFLVEEWQKQRQLADHMKSSLFAALLGIKGLLVKEPEIKFMNED